MQCERVPYSIEGNLLLKLEAGAVFSDHANGAELTRNSITDSLLIDTINHSRATSKLFHAANSNGIEVPRASKQCLCKLQAEANQSVFSLYRIWLTTKALQPECLLRHLGADCQKCDRQKPSCAQCRRSDIECSGYRDPTSLSILDQTSATASKYRANIGNRDPTQSSLSAAVIASPSKHSGRSQKVSPSPSMPLEDRGVGFFFSSYVIGIPWSIYAYLPELLLSEPAKSLLRTTITAVGLAALSSFSKDHRVLAAAARFYNSALSSARDALESAAAMKDQTLVSVLLFCVFEVRHLPYLPHFLPTNDNIKSLACSSSQAINSWLKHADGAVALVKLRGMQQFETELGCQLFLHLRLHNVCPSFSCTCINSTKCLKLAAVAMSDYNVDCVQYAKRCQSATRNRDPHKQMPQCTLSPASRRP